MNDTPFCEWKLKAWILLMVLFAAVVLAFSFWSAFSSGRIRVSGYHLSLGKQGAGPSMGPKVASPPNSPLSDPAAQLAALTNPYPRYPQWQGGTWIDPNQVDAVTMPTPMGGIKFIGGTQVRRQNGDLTPDFNRAADIIRPCVVDISAIRLSPLSRPPANPNGPRFTDPFDGVPDRYIGQRALESVGSGVIVDPSGYVVTNYHVVAGASTIIISRFLHQQGHYPARIIASDPGRDLALLQIQGDGPFPAATLADSSQVEVGDWVLTVGNPFGLEHTVTAGIISGKRNSLLIDGVSFQGLLQTDAPINKGSSGGPLVNMSGEVVGINTAIYAPTGVFSGTGFAIPSNRVGAFVARFIENNNVTVAMQEPLNPGTVWLGIGVIDMTADLAAKLSYPHAGGVFVSSLVLDSPADEAEITRGDIITAVSGQPMQNSASLRDVVAGLSLGQTVSVTIWRDGKTESLRLKTRAGRTTGA
jgi:serine protease Do